MPDYKIIQLPSKELNLRCGECEKSIAFSEAMDSRWTTKGFEFDGLCYEDKKSLMRSKALSIIGDD